MGLHWIWSDKYDNGDGGMPSGPAEKNRPHAEVFTNVGKYPLVNTHIENGFSLNGTHYFTEFYEIPVQCHAVVTITEPAKWPEDFTHFYLNAPLYDRRMPDNWHKRYPSNAVVFGLELGWAKLDNEDRVTEWKYENIHILNPPCDTKNHLPYYDSVLARRGQYSNSGVWIKHEPMIGYKLMWANLHVYNMGSGMYCGSIDLAVWTE